MATIPLFFENREIKRREYFKGEGVVKGNSVGYCGKVKQVEYREVSLCLATRRMLVTLGSLVAMDAKTQRLCGEWGVKSLVRGKAVEPVTMIFGLFFHDWDSKGKGQRKTFCFLDRQSKGSQPQPSPAQPCSALLSPAQISQLVYLSTVLQDSPQNHCSFLHLPILGESCGGWPISGHRNLTWQYFNTNKK